MYSCASLLEIVLLIGMVGLFLYAYLLGRNEKKVGG